MYRCITVESQDQRDHGSSTYTFELKEVSTCTVRNNTRLPNAEVPCVTKDQRGMILQYDQIYPNPVTDKIDLTKNNDKSKIIITS